MTRLEQAAAGYRAAHSSFDDAKRRKDEAAAALKAAQEHQSAMMDQYIDAVNGLEVAGRALQEAAR